MTLAKSLFVIAVCTGAVACATHRPPPPPPPGAERVVYVSAAPPAEIVEAVPAQPSPDHVWIRGHYRWDANHAAYIWLPGHWQVHPAGYVRWVPGHWQQADGRWYWVEGHWRA